MHVIMIKRALVPCLAAIAFAGCSRDTELPDHKALSVTPQAATAAPLESLSFKVEGGSQPYALAFVGNSSATGATAKAELSGDAITYTAGGQGSTEDRLSVSDQTGRMVEVRVSVSTQLQLFPPAIVLVSGETFTFRPVGGKGPYPLWSSAAGNAIDTDGTYHAVGIPTGRPNPDVVTVEDSVHARATAYVTVNPPLDLFPKDVTIAPAEPFVFRPVGGKPPYLFTIPGASLAGSTDCPVGLRPAATVLCLEPSTGAVWPGEQWAGGTVTVTVTDSLSPAPAKVSATLHVTAPLSVGVPTLLNPGQSLDLAPLGGKGPYDIRFAVDPGSQKLSGNASGGALLANRYTAGASALQTDHVTITDSVGTQLDVPLTIGPHRIESRDIRASMSPFPPGVPFQPFDAQSGHLFVPGGHAFFGEDFIVRPRGILPERVHDVIDINGDGILDILQEFTGSGGRQVAAYLGTAAGDHNYWGGRYGVNGAATTLVDRTGQQTQPLMFMSDTNGGPGSCGIEEEPLYAFLLNLPASCANALDASWLVRFADSPVATSAMTVRASANGAACDHFRYAGGIAPGAPTATWSWAPATGGVGVYAESGPVSAQLHDRSDGVNDIAYLVQDFADNHLVLVAVLTDEAAGAAPDTWTFHLTGVTRGRLFTGPSGGQSWASVVFDGLDGNPRQFRMSLIAGSWTWQEVTPSPNPFAGRMVVGTGDFDGDGNFDVVLEGAAPSGNGRDWEFWFGDALGGYDGLKAPGSSPGTRYTGASQKGPMQLFVGDFNGDGKADVITSQPRDAQSLLGAAQNSLPALVHGGSAGATGIQVPFGVYDFGKAGKLDLVGADGQAGLWRVPYDASGAAPVWGSPLPTRITVPYLGPEAPPLVTDVGGGANALDVIAPNYIHDVGLQGIRAYLGGSQTGVDVLPDPSKVLPNARIMRMQLGDVDGDGVVDAVLFEGGLGKIFLQKGSGSGAAFTFAPFNPGQPFGSQTGCVTLVADPANKRLLSIPASNVTGAPPFSVTVSYYAVGGGITSEVLAPPSKDFLFDCYVRAELVDVDGDGKAELVVEATSLDRKRRQLGIARPGSLGAVSWTPISSSGVLANFAFADLNGDGPKELVYQLPPSPYLNVWRLKAGTLGYAP
jgi:hypothetical protein